MKNELTILADKYGCDKGSIKHNYTKIYNDYFYHIRNDEFKMLEIGFGEGASVNMWLDYFKNITLYCVDIVKELPEDKENLKFISADQSSTKQMSNIFKNNHEDFKIIIDDGSHVAEDQQYTFGYLFEYLESGGLYIIEDLNCKRRSNKKFEVEVIKTIKVLKNYNKFGQFNSRILTDKQINYINKHIDKVETYNNKIVFIKKR
jgi:hypothetical protein